MIRLYINDIRKSLENECYFAALSLALILPDICGMAEYPNKDVGDRYIGWCDSYLIPFMYSDNNGLSGETIYNLRNVYLHQGSINIDRNKIKDENNRIDKFLLVIGDDDKILEFSMDISFGGIKAHKAEIINVKHLCTLICDSALNYYINNTDKFSFECNAIHVKDLFSDELDITNKSDQIQDTKDIENIIKNDPKMKELIQNYIDSVPLDIKLPEQVKKDETKIVSNNTKTIQKKTKKATVDKKESQVRSFYGRHFRKKKLYKDRKEEIINIVLKSKTKKQLIDKLNSKFPTKEAYEIYQKLKPLVEKLIDK